MSDQGHWFKLWVSALHDPDLANLPLEDFARWAILGTYIKAHGTDGKVTLTAPARAICGLFQVADFAALRSVFQRLPNVREEMHEPGVSLETVAVVSLRNWSKYQGDYSTDRVRRFREMKRSKRRGEEKRGEKEKEEKKTRVIRADSDYLESLKTDPTYHGIDVTQEHGKMARWCEVNRKVPSRARFVNWLNRCERPMNGQPATPKPLFPTREA